MGIEVVPVEFECTNDDGDLVFKVKAFDDTCASVEIKALISPAQWPDIANGIGVCLEQMKLRGEGE